MPFVSKKMAWVKSMVSGRSLALDGRPKTPEQLVAMDFLSGQVGTAITVVTAGESEIPAELAALEISAVVGGPSTTLAPGVCQPAIPGSFFTHAPEPELEPEPEPPVPPVTRPDAAGTASPPSSPPVSPEKDDDDGAASKQEPDPRAEMTLTQKVLWEREHMPRPQAACTLGRLRSHSGKLDSRLVELKQITQECVPASRCFGYHFPPQFLYSRSVKLRAA